MLPPLKRLPAWLLSLGAVAAPAALAGCGKDPARPRWEVPEGALVRWKDCATSTAHDRASDRRAASTSIVCEPRPTADLAWRASIAFADDTHEVFLSNASVTLMVKPSSLVAENARNAWRDVCKQLLLPFAGPDVLAEAEATADKLGCWKQLRGCRLDFNGTNFSVVPIP